MDDKFTLAFVSEVHPRLYKLEQASLQIHPEVEKKKKNHTLRTNIHSHTYRQMQIEIL